MADLSRKHIQNVKPFRGLYDVITEKLLDHARHDLKDMELQSWIFGLIKAFDLRYQKWMDQEQEYLSTLYTTGVRHFELTGLAYLHIAYDLPIVLANSLKVVPEYQFNRYRFVYLDLHRIIGQSFLAKWDGKPRLLDLTGHEVWQTGVDSWIKSLREKTWDNALVLLNYSDLDRKEKLEEFRKSMLDQLLRSSFLIERKDAQVNGKSLLNYNELFLPLPIKASAMKLTHMAKYSLALALVFLRNTSYLRSILKRDLAQYFIQLQPLDFPTSRSHSI